MVRTNATITKPAPPMDEPEETHDQPEAAARPESAVRIPPSLIPKEGRKTSSFYVVAATWIVGAVFTGLFTLLVKKGYISDAQAGSIRGMLVEMVAELLPLVYLGVSGWVTKEFIKGRSVVSQAKADALGKFLAGDAFGSGPVAGRGGVAINVQPSKEGE